MKRLLSLLFLFGLAASARQAGAQCISLTGSSYAQDFDSLAITGTANTALPTGWALTETGGGARDNEQYAADTGSSTTGDTFSYGASANTERAFGGLQSGSLIPVIGACFTNNTGLAISTLSISYTGEQWRLGALGRVDRMDFQYSLNATDLASGTWTDENSLDFTAPATGPTTGALNGNLPANQVAVSSSINALSIADGASFWIRWNDLNASSSDDGLAVDGFNLSTGGGPSDNPPGVGSTVPANLATGVAASAIVQVTFNEAVDATGTWFTINCASSGAHTAAVSGGPITFTIDPDVDFAFSEVCSASVVAAQVSDQDLIDPPDNPVANYNFSFTTAGAPIAIHAVQGTGAASPMNGLLVSVEGIVTGRKSNGFFLQAPDAEVDGNPATSEGIFVFTGSTPPAVAAVANRVSVGGTVQEFPTANPVGAQVTELSGSPSVSLISTGNPLPAAVALSASEPDAAGAFDQLERYEGMRVSVASLTVVAPTEGFVSESSATSTSSGAFAGVVTGVALPLREPGIQYPDALPTGAPAGCAMPSSTLPPPASCVPRFDTDPEVIGVDSDSLGGPALDVATGAVVSGVIGPLDYVNRSFTVAQDPDAALAAVGGKTATPIDTPGPFQLTVGSFNLERFFDNVNDPSIGESVLTALAFDRRLAKASAAIRNYLLAPDVVAVIEMENITTLQALAARIGVDAAAASQPDPGYVAYLVEGNDVGGIDVGFLVKGALTVNSVTQIGKTATYINPNDGAADTLNDRPPLVLDAVVHRGADSFPLVVIVNHLRSFLGIEDETPDGTGTAGARVRAKRAAQAEFLADLIQQRQTADPNEHLLVVGDFNAFEFNDGYVDSMGTIRGNPAPATEVTLSSSDLVSPDLVDLGPTAPAADRYSYVFGGIHQTIDHVLASAGLAAAAELHVQHPRIDADFPEVLRNGTGPERISDHDPVVAFISPTPSITGVAPTTALGPAPITWTAHWLGSVEVWARPAPSGSWTFLGAFPASGGTTGATTYDFGSAGLSTEIWVGGNGGQVVGSAFNQAAGTPSISGVGPTTQSGLAPITWTAVGVASVDVWTRTLPAGAWNLVGSFGGSVGTTAPTQYDFGSSGIQTEIWVGTSGLAATAVNVAPGTRTITAGTPGGSGAQAITWTSSGVTGNVDVWARPWPAGGWVFVGSYPVAAGTTGGDTYDFGTTGNQTEIWVGAFGGQVVGSLIFSAP